MKIKKYIKTSSSKYKIILEDDTSLILYEDVILKFNLLLTKEIRDLEEILKYNDKFALYDKALTYISKKQRCESEIRKYLSRYTESLDDINNTVKKLQENNFLNPTLYIKSYINDKIYLTLEGPIKIKNDLLALGMNLEEIENELVIFNQELIEEKIKKYITKNIKSNKKSLYQFKNKMLLNLTNLGYSRNDILKYLDNINIDEDNLKEKEIVKLRKKYERKYSGYELEMVIKRKLYERGYQD